MSQPTGTSQSIKPNSKELPTTTATSSYTRDVTGDEVFDRSNLVSPQLSSPASATHGNSTAASPGYSNIAGPPGAASAANDPLNYGFQPATPGSLWQWNNALDFSNFGSFYEPQGQLVSLEGQFPMSAGFLQDFNGPSNSNPQATVPGTPITPNIVLSPRPRTVAPALSKHSSAPEAHGSVASKKRKVGQDSQTVQANPSATAPTRRHSTTRIPSVSDKVASGTTASSPGRQGGMRAPDSQASSAAASPVASAQLASAVDKSRQTADKGDPGISRPRRAETIQAGGVRGIVEVGKFNTALPPGKVFPIQIGSELFRLSGASISSDSPSYFSHYFSEQLLQASGKANSIKTLYIDRDPVIFKDIVLHLQGYHIKPRDGEHFIKLYADAQFYTLPRLTQQLFKSEIYIQVGDRHFQIQRELFSSPGDSPNYFSLGFAHFFSTPTNTFPGLDQATLLRPPAILPPSVPNRSSGTFADLLRLLQGYDLKIKDAEHRAELLRDARYFHLKGLEQRLIPCSITHNLIRGKDEIALRLEDLRQSGVTFVPDLHSKDETTSTTASTDVPNTPHSVTSPCSSTLQPTGYISYQRPFTDSTSCTLVLEISAREALKLDLKRMRATFSGPTKARITSLFQVIANKMNLPTVVPLGLMMLQSGGGVAAQPVSPANTGVSEDEVRVRVGRECWVEVDGVVLEWEDEEEEGEEASENEDTENEEDDQEMQDPSPRLPNPRRNTLPPVKQWKASKRNANFYWAVQRSQWRLRVEATEHSAEKVEVVMEGVRIEAYTEERFRNGGRAFLSEGGGIPFSFYVGLGLVMRCCFISTLFIYRRIHE